jgi:hypothetical protein
MLGGPDAWPPGAARCRWNPVLIRQHQIRTGDVSGFDYPPRVIGRRILGLFEPLIYRAVS